MLYDLVLKSRSCRRFDESERIPQDVLSSLCELARYTPSAANLQPCKFCLVTSPEECDAVLSDTRWGGYIKDGFPTEGERPTGYIVILNDSTISKGAPTDVGIVAQTMFLGATEKGYGGCMLGSFDNDRIKDKLSIPAHLDISLILALGKPIETVVIEDMKDGNVKYWRDEARIHHVPKRPISELII